jgi:heptosyltransferase-2
MARARAFIGNDSAATHLATGVGARQLIIFGSTAPRFGFLPPVESARVLGLDIGCRPCTDHGRQACPRFASPRCLDQVSVEMVIKSIQDWLEK